MALGGHDATLIPRRHHMNHDVQVIAHDGPRIDATGKDLAKRKDALLNPRLAVFEAFAGVFVFTARQRAAHLAVDAVKIRGDSVKWLWAGMIRH